LIEFILASGCLWLFLPFKELKRLQIEVLPFEDPVATLLRSVPDDGPQGCGYNVGERLNDLPTHKNSSEVWMLQPDDPMQKKPQGLEPCGFY
jgi:hypothetical protein